VPKLFAKFGVTSARSRRRSEATRHARSRSSFNSHLPTPAACSEVCPPAGVSQEIIQDRGTLWSDKSIFLISLLNAAMSLYKVALSVENETHPSTDFRVVLPWHDGLEPDPARGWSPAGSGRLERKEVIACVVITRGGSPKGSRRVARRASRIS
jgi:hypothetical protein